MKEYNKTKELILPDLEDDVKGLASWLAQSASECGRMYQAAFYCFDASRKSEDSNNIEQGRFQQASLLASDLVKYYMKQKRLASAFYTLIQEMPLNSKTAFKLRQCLNAGLIERYDSISKRLKETHKGLTNSEVFMAYAGSGDEQLRHKLWKAIESFRGLWQRTDLLTDNFRRLSQILYQIEEGGYEGDF